MNSFDYPKIIFLLRDIELVSHSWEQCRIKSIRSGGKWEHNRGFVEAVEEWNISLHETWHALQKWPEKIFVLDYDKLFRDDQLLETLTSFLNLPATKTVTNYWEKCARKRVILEKKRKIEFPKDIERQIKAKANMNLYYKLKSAYT